MPARLLMMNPVRKKRRRAPMTAKQAMYFGGGKRKRKGAPRRKLLTNPTPRKRRAIGVTVRRRRRGRGLFRNPIGFNAKGFLTETLLPSAVGAVGALGLDVAIGSIPLPDALQSGWANTATRVAGAVGLGLLATKLAGRRFGEAVMAGGIVVTAYDAIKPMVKSQFPGLPGLGYYGAAQQFDRLGVYVPPNGSFLEQPSPAAGDYDDGSGMAVYP